MMPEIVEEQKAGLFDTQYLLDVVRRRHVHFLIPLFLGWLMIWGASWILPVRYKSGTLILVQQPTMPRDYVLPNVSDNLQDRLQSITQQILSRTRLLLIIDQLNLYSKSRKHMTPDEKVEQMRKDIDIELVRDPRENQITAFNIYYSARDPHIAQQVTGELSKLFINANLEVRQQQSEDTTKFLEGQLDNARTSLAEQEEKIRQFKGEHMGELPGQQAANLQILSGLQQQLVNEQDALNTAQQQRVYLQTLINQYKNLQGSTRSIDGTPTRLPAIDKELDKLKAQLADLSSRYTDSYPDIRNLKSQIAKTEKVRDALIAELKNKGSVDNQTDDGIGVHDSAELLQNSQLLQLQSQLQANQSEIKNREQTVAGLKVKIADYQSRLNQEPVAEQQMADLTRGYDQSKANYDDLLKKKNQSEMATSMERLQQGERFSVLDPPSLPLKPDFPNRLKFCGLGIAMGLAFGLLVAGGFEFMDDRMHSEKEIKDLLPVAVISEIPKIVDQSEEVNAQKRTLLGWSMAVIIAVIILAGSAFNYLHS
jgi:polysaccharide chain length determinant protein (PEP-CTERM system associated)